MMKSDLNLNSLPTSPALRVEVLVQRKAEKSVLARTQRQGTKKRDIYAKYPDKAKADELIKRLRSRGLWHWDPDFDQDEEDRFAIKNWYLLQFQFQLQRGISGFSSFKKHPYMVCVSLSGFVSPAPMIWIR